MKRFSLLFISVAMACVLAFSLTGCFFFSNDSKVIKDGLSDALEQWKNYDSNLWQVEMKDALKEFESLGINSKDLVNAWIEGFDYKVGTVKINGNKATVEITITCKQFYPASAAADEKLSSVPGIETMTDAQITKKYGELLIAELKAAKPVTTTFTTTCTKKDKIWNEDTSSEQNYIDALMGQL